MSLLAPLYLLAGSAIGLPILVHLIRRRPKAEMTFSSLMFLRESPPRLTKRSRLDDWPLLLMRALALILLAIAFARPFLRSAETHSAESLGRKLVLMIDTSASMRRPGIAEAASDRVAEFVDELQPGDAVSVVTFDGKPKVALAFDQAATMDPADLKSTIRQIAAETQATWVGTDLAAALTFAADEAVNESGEAAGDGDADADAGNESADEDASAALPANLVVVTDLQSGSGLTSLQSFVWPENVHVDLRPVVPRSPGNAAARPLRADPADASGLTAQTDAAGKVEKRRIRVSNSPNASRADFQIAWGDANAFPRTETNTSVQVPPGQSRVITLPAPRPGDATLILTGDGQDFDNTYYFATPTQRQLTLLYIGRERSEPREDPAFYLSQVPLDAAARRVTLEQIDADDPETWRVWRQRLTPKIGRPASGDDVPADNVAAGDVPLVVLGDAVSSDVAGTLKDYIDAGGHVLAVVGKSDSPEGWEMTLSEITAVDSVTLSEAKVRDYAMLSQIDFLDPLFAPMADPKFNDFSKLRFWSHRDLTLGDDTEVEETFAVPARFDDGKAAMLRRGVGRGKVTILLSGWQPAESQLALSTKFIPLLYGWFDPGDSAKSRDDDFTVGDVDEATGVTFDTPGIQTIRRGDVETQVAVNLAIDESRTGPLDSAELETLGVRLGRVEQAAVAARRNRQLRDIELENQQSIWRILLLAAIGLLATETLWSSRRKSSRQETN